ncbi:MAG: phenylacetate--CoA ligase family protein, partial [Thermoanaerobaculia bacterium]
VGAWGFGCLAEDLGVHLNELEFFFEVIDPETDAAAENGARGELVITTLGRQAMPVVRYRTGDLVVRDDGPCDCGRTLSRIEGGVLGRADDMLIVRGVNVYPSAIDNLMRGLAQVVEYEVEIRRRQALDDLLVKVETVPGEPFEAVEQALHETFRAHLNIRVDIAPAAAGSLPRYELKAQRFKRVD